jgi:hypothetical protein
VRGTLGFHHVPSQGCPKQGRPKEPFKFDSPRTCGT